MIVFLKEFFKKIDFEKGKKQTAIKHKGGKELETNLSLIHSDGKELSEEEIHALTSPLSNHHAVVVRRRVDTLTNTLRKKQKYTTKIDVRNIFPQQNSTGVQRSQSDATWKHPQTKQVL